MTVHQATVEVRTGGPGTRDITQLLEGCLAKSGLKAGIMNVFCQHTSCSLVVMENASPEVHRDLERFMNRLAPRGDAYEHHLEGPDDMPAHIRTALTRTSETIPFAEGRLLLGTWQGIYLWEHRDRPHTRTLAVTCIGE